MTIFLETNEPGKPGTVARCEALALMLNQGYWVIPSIKHSYVSEGTWEGITSPNVTIQGSDADVLKVASFFGLAFSQDAVGLGDDDGKEIGLVTSDMYRTYLQPYERLDISIDKQVELFTVLYNSILDQTSQVA